MTQARKLTFFNIISGASLRGAIHAIDIALENSNIEKFNFAARYDSMEDFLCRTANIALSPIGHVACTLQAVQLSIKYLLAGRRQASAEFLFYATAFILTAALSPLINFIDLVGGGINTALEANSDSSLSA